MKNILIVCTGNTCRSSMAEAILKQKLIENNMAEKYNVSSAGIAAMDGEPASKNSVEAMRCDFKIDITSHKARLLTPELIKNASVVLTMTRAHRDTILKLFPGSEGKTYTLKEIAFNNTKIGDSNNFSLDIADPYGLSLDYYKKCAHEIDEALEALLQKL